MEHQAPRTEAPAAARPVPAPEPAPALDRIGGSAALLVQRVLAGDPPPDPGGHPGPLPAVILDLQRTAGNAAVADWLRHLRAAPRSAGRPSPVVAMTRGGGARPPSAGLTAMDAGLAATEAVALEDEDLEFIREQLESEASEEGASGAATGESAGGEGAEGGQEGASESASRAADRQADEVAGLTCIVLDRGLALTGILADGGGTPVATRSLSDLEPGLAEVVARAGVVSTEFSDAAFRSLRALGYIDIGAGKVYPPDAILDVSGMPPEGSGFKKQFRLLPTTTRDYSFKVIAAPAGTYDTGQTVVVNVGGQAVELKKMVEVTEAVAARTSLYEQEHVDDTVVAFQMTFQEAADAVNYFADAPDGANPIYFRGESEEEVAAYVEGRLTDFHGRRKLGGKKADWVAAYKKLLALTISERDARGTHSWTLAPKPKVDRAAGTVTYQLNPPTVLAGPSFTEITWDKV